VEGDAKMNLSVIVPFCPDGGRRDQNYYWVTRRLRALLPDAEILIPMQEYAPFSRSATHNMAAKQATKDVLLFCDADMVFDLDLIENGLKIVRDVPWIAPMNQKWDFGWQASNQLLNMDAGVEIKSLNLPTCRKWGAERCRAGAMIMITRENYFKMGGFDERFNGWGYEDNAFLLMAEATIGSFVETDNIAYHLWHPQSINQYPQLTAQNRDLYTEYFKHFEEGDLVEWVQNTGRILK
jgi:predicted glycosyltransferase involved in capsule biosynthesis